MNFICDPNLVLHLPLYRLDGSSFMSRDAYGHLCTVTGALWTPQGRTFDGVDDQIRLFDDGSAPGVTSEITVQLWVNIGTQTVKRIIGYTSSWAQNKQWLMSMDTTAISFSVFNGVAESKAYLSTNTLATGGWLFVTGTWNNNFTTIDVSCKPGAVNGNPIGAVDLNNINPINISLGTLSMDAAVGKVLIYNRALTTQEIQYNYQATKWRYR